MDQVINDVIEKKKTGDQLLIIRRLEDLIGHTRLHKLNYSYGNLYTKLEHQNFFGSIKDRPAFYILKKAIETNLINSNSIIVESTSGNFGVALSGICRMLKIKFVPVVDPNISTEKESILRLNGCEIIKVTERDETGGFLLNRIKTVKNFLAEHENAYTPNQYENPDNYMAYYHTLGQEIAQGLPKLDYAFISVSTGGTITGLSNRLKEQYRNIKIIGVDVEGSLVFSNKPQTRKLSGMGSSMKSVLMDNARIDDYVIFSQREIIKGCHDLLLEHNLFLGGSSGAAYLAADMLMKKLNRQDLNAIFIAPDAGNSYLDTIYNPQWVAKNIL